MKKSCGVLVQYKDTYLLGHASGQGRQNFGIPKGGQEKGETDEETALRELYEETSIRLTPGYLSSEPLIQYRAKNGKYMTVFLAQREEKPENVECLSYVGTSNRKEFDYFVWVTKEEGLEMLANNHMKQIFERLCHNH